MRSTTVRIHSHIAQSEYADIVGTRIGHFFIGAIPATGIMVGTETMNSTWAWRLPLLLQVRPYVNLPYAYPQLTPLAT